MLFAMTKKEYILAVIDALPEWEMWRWIKAMVQNNQLEDATIDKLVVIFKKAVSEIATYIKENRVIEKIKVKQKFDKQQQEQEKKDAESLNKLDSMLNDL